MHAVAWAIVFLGCAINDPQTEGSKTANSLAGNIAFAGVLVAMFFGT
jgi:hypothetical protein